MINKLKIILLTFLSASNLLFLTGSVALAAPSNPLEQACNTNAQTKDSPLCKQAAGQGTEDPIAGPNGVINKAANIIAIITAIGAVIMILIGAFEFVTAGGTGFKSAVAGAAPTRVAKARARIASGLIGLVVVALAWALVRLITDRVLR